MTTNQGSETMTTGPAVFVDRHTMRYDRRYPHPIELVWDAVSMGEHLDVWLLPITRVERRVGGRCSFTWGGDDEAQAQIGTVTECEPPRLITYTFEPPVSFMRFALEPDGDGTLLHFTLHWPVPAGSHLEPMDFPGGDLPAGTDTAWRPGQLAGFHLMLDDLTGYLAGTFTAADRAAQLGMDPARHEEWMAIYRTFVAEQCPPA
jgi:uncharacterized protein YndB with AHSA1/START domain